MAMQLLSIATALPQYDMTQSVAARYAQTHCGPDAGQQRRLPRIYQRCGIDRRSSVLLEPGNGSGPVLSFYPPADDAGDCGPTTDSRMSRYSAEAPRLAWRCAEDALQQASITPQSVTHLVTVSCTGFQAPGFDVELIKQLRLRPTVSRTHVGFMGCHGAFNAMRTARAYVDADKGAVVLVCAVELCSLHFQYGSGRQRIVANALFADGAAAFVGVADSSGRRPGTWKVAANGSCILPDSEKEMTWRIGDHGFVMTLSRRVPELIGLHLRPWLSAWLAELGLELSQVGSWAIHPGGPSIVSAVAEALQLSPAAVEPSRQVLAECGNMSSPTVLFIIDRLQRQGAARPCVALGFGPGLTAESVLLT